MTHGYYNLDGDFIETDTREEATAAWRDERGYDPIGVFDMGDGEIVDTTNEQVSAPAAAAPPCPETVGP